MKYYRFRRRKVEGENTFRCSLWTWLEAMELKCNIFTPILFSVTMKYSKFLLFCEAVVWTSIWGKINQRDQKSNIFELSFETCIRILYGLSIHPLFDWFFLFFLFPCSVLRLFLYSEQTAKGDYFLFSFFF